MGTQPRRCDGNDERPPNHLFRHARGRLRTPAGTVPSRREIADLVNVYLYDNHRSEPFIDRNYVGKIESGRIRWPSPIRRAAFRHVLGVRTDADIGFWPGERGIGVHPAVETEESGAAIGNSPFVVGIQADDVALLPRITEIVLVGAVVEAGGLSLEAVPLPEADPLRHVGAEDVARIEATTRVFRDWDNRWGGGLSSSAVMAQLRWVAACATRSSCVSVSVRTRLLTALADLAGLAAFLCYDLTAHTQARQLWLLGLRAGSQAGNADVVGTTLRQLAHQALHLDRVEDALRLVRLAYASTLDAAHHTSELALAEIAAYEGWCYAAAGHLQPCHRAWARAYDHFDNAAADPPPPWLAHLDRTELTALHGHAYHVLAHQHPAMAEPAADLLRTAITTRSGEYARSKTLNLIALSATYFQHGEHIEEGITIGDQALHGAATLQSPRALDRLRALRRLTNQHTDKPGVPAFRHRIDHALTDA